MALNIDRIDGQLLELLQEHGRISQHDLARSVGLSAPAVAERLRKLEDRGLISGFTAILDPKRLGLDVTAFIVAGVSGSKHFPDFRAAAEGAPEVLECHSVTGQGSHLLKVRVENTGALERLLAEVQAWPGVEWTQTSIVLSTLKETTQLRVPYPAAETGSGRDGAEETPSPADLLHVPFRHHP
ncbi:MAG TPA: Lrp/AsnC family transcriptional regulator [Longimicrobiaceae bacterium]|nr:Lrp/AsnC family transcriptional regulator [Longimicrobiaceae bacterium]